jgi:hypothetical protein
LSCRSPPQTGRRFPIPLSIAATILGPLHQEGVAAAIAKYCALKTSVPGDCIFNPNELNRIGYALLHKGRVFDAIAIWELNAGEHPGDWNVHDSLAGERRFASDAPGPLTPTLALLIIDARPGPLWRD